jgi:hypothetical protein
LPGEQNHSPLSGGNLVKDKMKNIPASVHQRLLNIAKEENRPLNELLQYFAIERFLFRLGKSKYRSKFILKGAQMMRVWNAPKQRPTKDIDLLGKTRNEIEYLEKIVREVCQTEVVDDGVTFDLESIKGEPIKKDADYQGVRINLKGLLGKIKLDVQIDFGFGDVVVPSPKNIKLPELLDYGKPDLQGYTPESTFAEKFEAMVSLDLTNTRLKDFFDMWLLSTSLNLDRDNLKKAIDKTFSNRNTELPRGIPNALTPKFYNDTQKQKQWKAFLKKNRLDDNLKLEEIISEIKEFLLNLDIIKN